MSPIFRVSLASGSRIMARGFASSRGSRAKNQIYASVRRPDDLHTYQLLSSSARTPLLTLWTTSWCATCRVVQPLTESLVASGVGEAEGGVAFCAVEYDAPDIMTSSSSSSGGGGGGGGGGSGEGLAMTYMITGIPTLLSFDAVGPVAGSRVTDGRKLADPAFLEAWIRNEARRYNDGGGGGGAGGKGILGGLFGGWR